MKFYLLNLLRITICFFPAPNPGLDTNRLLRSPPDSTLLDSRVFDNFILADELFAKSFTKPWSYENNLCEKLLTSLESQITFDERFKITSALCFILYSNLLSCELENFIFKLLYESFYVHIILNQNKFTIY